MPTPLGVRQQLNKFRGPFSRPCRSGNETTYFFRHQVIKMALAGLNHKLAGNNLSAHDIPGILIAAFTLG